MIYLTHAVYPYEGSDDERRRKRAHESWMQLPDVGPPIGFVPVQQPPHRHLRITELLDAASAHATGSDIIAYANSDAGLTEYALPRISLAVERGNGVCFCPRRSLVPEPDRQYDYISSFPMDAGIDVVACSISWWAIAAQKMPPMYVGRGGWDMVWLIMAQGWADGQLPQEVLDRSESALKASKACADGVCWHEPHAPDWISDLNHPEQLENVRLAVEFCTKIGNPTRVFC